MNVVLLSLNVSNHTLCYSFSWLPLLVKLFKESCTKCSSKRPCHKQICNLYVWIASSVARNTESRNLAAATWKKNNIMSSEKSLSDCLTGLCVAWKWLHQITAHTIKYWRSLMRKTVIKEWKFYWKKTWK